MFFSHTFNTHPLPHIHTLSSLTEQLKKNYSLIYKVGVSIVVVLNHYFYDSLLPLETHISNPSCVISITCLQKIINILLNIYSNMSDISNVLMTCHLLKLFRSVTLIVLFNFSQFSVIQVAYPHEMLH